MAKQSGTAFILVTMILIIIITAFIGTKIFFPLSPSDGQVLIRIKSGSSVKIIADSLARHGVISETKYFILVTKIFGNSAKLKAGLFLLNKDLSPYQAMKRMVAGRAASIKVSIPEGYTVYEIASVFSRKLESDSAKFVQLTRDKSFISSLGLNVISLEGYLFPNTYTFEWKTSEEEIIKTMVMEFNRNFNDSLKKEVIELGWSPHQILTLASIIEGEAMIDSERAIISAVYHNRLKRKIPLQADPTIQYIIPDGRPRRLLHRDLQIDSPYNTYRYAGLPPGPINNPGMKSILAAIYPSPVDYLYFVAKGDGSHIFSTTLEKHLEAKAAFDILRAKVNQRKKFTHRSLN